MIMTNETAIINQDLLLQEFEQMRQTIRGLVSVIKKQDTRLYALEGAMASVPTMSREEILLERYTISSKVNRSINATPRAVAYAAHLYYIKQIPAMRISESGLLSQSKMYGLSLWSKQHLLDFCDVNDVRDVYLNGVEETEQKELMPKFELYQAYLDKVRSA